MLATVVCAVLCGARGYAAIAEWLHKWPLDFCHRLGYLRRPPKKGAFRNLLLALDAERFERAIADWMSQTLNVTLTEDDLQGVSIDGKWLRGTRDARDRMVVLLAAFDHRTGGVFAQHRVPEGTNEAKAVLDLLEQLILLGRVITADAAFCQQEVCEAIVHRQGHYALAVKDKSASLETGPFDGVRRARRGPVIHEQGSRQSGVNERPNANVPRPSTKAQCCPHLCKDYQELRGSFFRCAGGFCVLWFGSRVVWEVVRDGEREGMFAEAPRMRESVWSVAGWPPSWEGGTGHGW